jgi:hypothetical protein
MPELGQKKRAHAFNPGRHAGVRPTPARARPCSRSSPSRALARAAPIKQPRASAVHPHTLTIPPKPDFAGLCPEHDAPPPAKPPEPRPPRPAHPSRSQSAPAARLASTETREAPQALGPGRASPETLNHPRRTSYSHRRTWTG